MHEMLRGAQLWDRESFRRKLTMMYHASGQWLEWEDIMRWEWESSGCWDMETVLAGLTEVAFKCPPRSLRDDKWGENEDWSVAEEDTTEEDTEEEGHGNDEAQGYAQQPQTIEPAQVNDVYPAIDTGPFPAYNLYPTFGNHPVSHALHPAQWSSPPSDSPLPSSPVNL
jgi:hypothetical protein